MATHKPIKWALVGMASAVVAGVVALQTGAVAEAVQFVQNLIQRLPRRDGSHEEDEEDQGQSGQESGPELDRLQRRSATAVAR
jgi:hypothetical protein